MLELVVTEKIDGNPVAWRCSDCRQSFSARGKLSANERIKKVMAEFKSHVEESHTKSVASGIGYSAIASH